ncbi:hypothetical protein ACW0JT_10015 [Arthrobacter sp. SA17]
MASGNRRILSQANNGELVSYLPEEYGVARTGLGPKITTVWGHGVYTFLIWPSRSGVVR